MGLTSRLSRRGFVASAATAASAVLLAACGSPPPPTTPAVEPPAPAHAPKPPPPEIQNYIKDNYLPSAVATGTWEGKIMGHPTENQPHMMFVNTKMFQAAKLDATKDTPKKWDDIRKVAKQLTVKDAGGVKTQ